MINKILIPTDFSSVANNALVYAIELAKKCNASIQILHVVELPYLDPNYSLEAYQMFITEMEKNANEGKAKLELEYLKPSQVSYQFCIETGFVANEIDSFSIKNNIDMIVMGTTGASGLSEVLIGSNAASVVGKAHVPILIIPPHYVYKNMQHILYASDYNEPEFPAISRMLFMVDLFQSKVSVLHIKNEYDNYFNQEHNFFKKNKDVLATNNINFINIENNNVIEGIDKKIDELNVDLLIMAKHNRSFFDRLFHRSLSKRMSYHSKIPLMVLNK